jgi:HNH endonuclease
MAPKRFNYRKLAFATYDPLCAHCGFGIPSVLEVAHIDGSRANNAPSNLVILCPNCHKMHDLDLISTATIIHMRDRPKIVTWSKRMKDAGKKALLTRKLRESKTRRKWRLAGFKAAETRRKNLLAKSGQISN